MDFRTNFGNCNPILKNYMKQLDNDFYKIVKSNMKDLFYLWILFRIAGLWLFISSLWAANIEKTDIDWFSSIEMHDVMPRNPRITTSTSKAKNCIGDWTLVHMNAQYLRVPSRDSNKVADSHLQKYYGNWMTPHAAEKHAETLGLYLDSLNADFIHLCEVHDKESVEAVLKYFKNPEEYNIYTINFTESYKRWYEGKKQLGFPLPPPTQDESKHNMACAFITKFPLVSSLISFTKIHSHKGKCLNLGRNLAGYFLVPGYDDPVFIGGIHLPRQLSLQVDHGEFLLQRLKEFIQKYSHPHTPKNMILMGDFNSGDSDLGVITSKQTMSGMVKRFKSEFGDNPNIPLQSAMQSLSHKQFTHKVGIIDHILLSMNIKRHFHSITVPDIDVQKLSDHAPLIVKFKEHHSQDTVHRRIKLPEVTKISKHKQFKISSLSLRAYYAHRYLFFTRNFKFLKFFPK